MRMQMDDAMLHVHDVQAKLRRELQSAGARDLAQYLTMPETSLVARTCFHADDMGHAPSAGPLNEFRPSEVHRPSFQHEPRHAVPHEQHATHHVTRQEARLGAHEETSFSQGP